MSSFLHSCTHSLTQSPNGRGSNRRGLLLVVSRKMTGWSFYVVSVLNYSRSHHLLPSALAGLWHRPTTYWLGSCSMQHLFLAGWSWSKWLLQDDCVVGVVIITCIHTTCTCMTIHMYRSVHQEDLVVNLKQALTRDSIPEITQTILNLAEFMEHCEEATVSLLSVCQSVLLSMLPSLCACAI